MNRKIILISNLILIFFIIAAPALWADRKEAVICDFCKDTIKTQYIEFEGKKYHPIHFQCDECGTVIGHIQFYAKDGKKYCKKCYEKLFATRCAYCGEIIEGEFVVANTKSYHRFCYNQYVATKCAVTGYLIKGDYLKDYWGNVYHPICRDEYNQCYYCGRFISERTTGGGVEYNDGRNVCNLCLASAVKTNQEALGLLEEARDKLAIADIFVTEKISLHLVNLNELKKIANARMIDPAGYTKFESTLITSKDFNNNFDIYILEGMPRFDFILTAAHELMHVWQYKNGKRDNDFALCEGSCNYAAYLVLRQYDEPYAQYLIYNMEKSENELYGDGYQRVKKYVDDNDVKKWLKMLTKNKDFPDGY
ncbi:MAG: LIM domain-containing protein [Candidatus Zixiibacteriota bacterium]